MDAVEHREHAADEGESRAVEVYSDSHMIGARVFPSPFDEFLVPQTLPARTLAERGVVTPVPAAEIAPVEMRRDMVAENDFYSSGLQQDEYEPAPKLFSKMDVVLFFIFFLIPSALGIVYYGFYASDQYVSEFRFNVVDTSSQSSAISGGLASMLGSSGMGASATESYTVTDFLVSPQAVDEVEKKLPLRKLFTTPGIDMFARLDANVSKEELNTYWQKMVSSYFDPVTGIATAQVRAFTAQDAYAISNALLKSAERLVNGMQDRQRQDSIRFAKDTLDRDNVELTKIRKEMLALRQKSGYIEPSASGVLENTTLATNLRVSIVSQQADLDAVKTQSPHSPLIGVLTNKINSAKKQLADVEKEISSKGGSGPLAITVGQFDDLNARQATATSIVTADLTSLQQAKAAAEAQHIYLSTYVYPTYPTSSTQPRRGYSIILSFLVAFAMFCFAKLVTTAIKSQVT